MLIIGAGGFAKELLEVCLRNDLIENLNFYDIEPKKQIFFGHKILNNLIEVKNYFNTIDNKFAIGLGNPKLRQKNYINFCALGGEMTSIISQDANIGSFDVEIGNGCIILGYSFISNSVSIGMGSLIYYKSIITHDVCIGDFVELSPAATILGGCEIGSFTHIGANSTILPKIKIGNNVIVGAGSVVTKDVPNNSIIAGNPARILRNNET